MRILILALAVATFPGVPVYATPEPPPVAQVVPVVPKLSTTPVEAIVTAYSSSPDETDATPFTTASGEPVSDGTVACPARYPFGTKVYISGKLYVCWDRLNPRYQDLEVWDIWMPSKAQAVQWGRRVLKIEVVDEPSKETM